MKLYNSLRAVILEVANKEEVLKAIKDKKVTTIYYEGDSVNNPGWRTIEPVCAGTTKRNRLGWKFFVLDKIRNWDPTMDEFTEERPNYNPNGDKSMNQVWGNAKF